MVVKILIAAGGTGGHLFPAQQLSELLLQGGDCSLMFAGHKLDQSPFFAKEKIPFTEIASAPTKKKIDFFRASWKGFWQSVQMIRKFKPDVVVGFGSYHSFPVLLAAAVFRKKIVLFEANSLLGKVNRLFLPAAEVIALQFPITCKKSVLVPLLPWSGKKRLVPKEEARLAFGLDPQRKTLLVFGGSQGAVFLNEVVPQAVQILRGKGFDFQVLHLTGKGNRAEYADGATVKEFETEMNRAYGAADWVICRSGAGTCAELIRYQKPALLIPYPFASEDHQYINGRFLVEKGGARLVRQQEAQAERIAAELQLIWQEESRHVAELRKWMSKETADLAAIIRNIGKK